MVCVATLRVEVVKVAWSEAIVTAGPSATPPSLKVMVPVAPAVTPAVKVTLAPKVEGLSDDMSVVVLVALFTTCITDVDVLGLWVESPEYSAVMVCVATLRLEVMNVAVPADSVTALPSATPPSLNVTVPVASEGLTVAVKVTAAPKVEGLSDDMSVVVVG